MLKAIDENGNNVLYLNGKKNEMYYCPNPNCREKLIFKKGLIRIPHFSHYHKTLCGINEERDTETHDFLKLLTYNFFNSYLEDLEYEIWKNNNRADLLSEKHKIILECQCSIMKLEDVKKRIINWQKNGYKVIWIFHENFFKKFDDCDNVNKDEIPDKNFIFNKYEYIKVNSMLLYINSYFKDLYYIKNRKNIDKGKLTYYSSSSNPILFSVELLSFKKIIKFNKYKRKDSGKRFIYKEYKNKKRIIENEIKIEDIIEKRGK